MRKHKSQIQTAYYFARSSGRCRHASQFSAAEKYLEIFSVAEVDFEANRTSSARLISEAGQAGFG